MAGVKTQKSNVGRVTPPKQIKKEVTLVVENYFNEEGNMKQKKYFVHEIIEDNKK